MNAMRLFISVAISTSIHDITASSGLTSIYLALLHVLPRHGVGLDNLGKGVGLEVLLARLFLGATFSGILLHGFKLICPSSELILSLFEKVARLLAHLDHPVRGGGCPTFQQFARPDYTQKILETREVPGTVPPQCIQGTTYRWPKNRGDQAKPRETCKIEIEYKCTLFAARHKLNRSQ